MKQDWKPGTMIYPLPALLVSCGSTEEEYNIITVAWAGTICTNPAMCYISVRPERHSYPHSETEYGIRHQPYYQKHGIRYRLVRSAFGQRL